MYIFIIYYSIEITSHLSTQEVKKEKKKKEHKIIAQIFSGFLSYIFCNILSVFFEIVSRELRVRSIRFFRFSIFGVSRVLTRQELKPDSILDIRIGQEQRVKLGDCDSCCNCRLCAFLCVCACVCRVCKWMSECMCVTGP